MNKIIYIFLMFALFQLVGCAKKVDLNLMQINAINIDEKPATKIKSVTCSNNLIKFSGNGLLSYNYNKLYNGELSLDFYNVNSKYLKIHKSCKNLVTGPANINSEKSNFTIYLNNMNPNISNTELNNEKLNNTNLPNINLHAKGFNYLDKNTKDFYIYHYVNNIYVTNKLNNNIYNDINNLESNKYILNREITFINKISETFNNGTNESNFQSKVLNSNMRPNELNNLTHNIDIYFSNPIKVIETNEKENVLIIKIQGNIGKTQNALLKNKLEGSIIKEISFQNEGMNSYIYIYRLNPQVKAYMSIDSINNHLVIYSSANE